MRSDSKRTWSDPPVALPDMGWNPWRAFSPPLVEEMVTSLPYSIAALDRHGVIVSTNEAWRRFASENGAPELADSSVGLDYLEICRRATGPFAEGSYQAMIGIQSVLDGSCRLFTLEYPCPSPTEQRWFLMLVTQLPAEQGGAIVSHIPLSKSESERERAQRLTVEAEARTKAETTARALSQLQMVTDVALGAHALPDLESALMGRIRQVMAVDTVWITLVTEDGRELALHATQEGGVEAGVEMHTPIGQGVMGRVAASREPLVVNDLTADEMAQSETIKRGEIRSFAGAPLLAAGQLIGVLGIGSKQPRHFTPEEVDFLRLVSDRIALALEQARLYTIAQRARAEAETRAKQLAVVVESISDPFFVFDGEGVILFQNAADRAFLGLAPDAPGPRTIWERGEVLRLSDLQGHLLQGTQWPVSRVLRGETLTGRQITDLLFQTLDGREVVASVSGSPIRDAQGKIIGGVLSMRDVTERRAIERRTRELLEAMLAMAEALVEPELRAIDMPGANLVARRLAELTCNVLGCERISISALESDELWVRAIVRVGWTPQEEERWYREARQYRLADVATDAQIAELRAGNVVVIARPTPWSTAPVPGEPQILIAPLRTESGLTGTLSIDFGDQPHIYTTDEMSVAHAVGRFVALVLEREHLLREREEAIAGELASRKVKKRMDEFLAMATHDLRTPVAAAKLGVQVARRRIELELAAVPDAEARAALPVTAIQTHLRLIEESMGRLVHLVDRLMDVSRVRAGKLELRLERHDLRDIIRQVVEEQRLLAPDRSLRLRLPARPVVTLADADRIGQVATNFLTNALRYAPGQSPIDIGLRVTGRHARLSVRDRGSGIRLEEQAGIWERFQQAEQGKATAATSGGLGIGLYISREIIQLHGGQTGVRSIPGQGSTFWFTLPLAPDAGESTSPASVAPTE